MWRRVLPLLFAGVVLVPTPAAAQSSEDGACPAGDGVTVVVDFQSLQEETLVRCGRGLIENGLDVLAEARIAYDPLVEQQGVICRIETFPADADCGAPETQGDATWSYWTAQPGGEWEPVDGGPLSRVPPDGSVDGWSFGASDDPLAPRTSPPTPGADRPDPDPVLAGEPSVTESADPSSSPSPGAGTDDGDGRTDGGDDGTEGGTATGPDATGADAPSTGEQVRVDTDGDGVADADATVVRDGAGAIASIQVDTDGDGTPDTPAVVADGATEVEGEVLAVDLEPEGVEESEGDGRGPVLIVVASALALVGGLLFERRRRARERGVGAS